MYCSTHRVPSATKRRSLPTSYRSYRYRHRYQYKSLPDYFFIGQRGVDGAAARAINMGRSRTRSRYIRRFFSKARGWLSVCSLLRTYLRTSFSRFGLSSSSSLLSCFRCRPSRVRRLPHLEPPVPRLVRTVRPPLRRRRLRVATLPVGLAPLSLGSRLRPQVPWPRPVPLPPWSAPMTWPGSHR